MVGLTFYILLLVPSFLFSTALLLYCIYAVFQETGEHFSFIAQTQTIGSSLLSLSNKEKPRMGFRSPVPESSSLNKINFFAGLFSRKAHNLHNILTISKVEIVSSEVVNLHDYL